MFLVRLFGYKKRTAFLTGNALAQTSEFSFIIVTLGFTMGHISAELFSTLILLTILTMSFTTYFISYERKLVNWLSWPLNVLEGIKSREEELEFVKDNNKDIVIFGCHRIGSLILKEFEKHKDDVLVVDYNPQIIRALMDKKIPSIYGDFMHQEVLDKVNLKNSKIFVSTIPDFEDNMSLIRKIKKENSKAVIIIVASRISEAKELYKQGADYVILPKFISGEKASDVIRKAKKGRGEISKLKIVHKKYLNSISRLLW